tara:strand:- start:828 stop:1205 length:378 start_codon:yes stop_codon:yes gene_type:complete
MAANVDSRDLTKPQAAFFATQVLIDLNGKRDAYNNLLQTVALAAELTADPAARHATEHGATERQMQVIDGLVQAFSLDNTGKELAKELSLKNPEYQGPQTAKGACRAMLHYHDLLEAVYARYNLK